MRICLAILIILAVSITACLPSASPPALEGKLRIITEVFPPFNFVESNQNVTGQSTEIVRAIMQKLGMQASIDVMPLADGLTVAQEGPDVAIFSLNRTPQREELFKWVGPIGSYEQAFYAKKGSTISLNSLEDAQKVGKIGVYKGDAGNQFLASQGFTNLDESQTDAIQFALHGQQPVSLIHGPPGTGKTTTVAELIQQAVHVHKMRVLVTAPSNVAVDNVLERLVANQDAASASASTKHKDGQNKRIRAVRLGHPARIQPSILRYSLESLVQNADGTEIVNDIRSEMKAHLRVASNPKSRPLDKRTAYREMKLLRKELRQREGKVVESLLADAQVVLTTNVGAASHVLDKFENSSAGAGKPFDWANTAGQC